MTSKKVLYRILLQRSIRLFYPIFLVFITPLGLIAAVYTVYAGLVEAWHLGATFLLICLSGLGITIGYHRLMTHRSFETYPFVKGVFLILGALAMQGPPLAWGSLHIQHHRFSDKEGDPHSPLVKSFWYAHCGWIFQHYTPQLNRYGKWLLKDKVVMGITRLYHPMILVSIFLPWIVFGWVAFVWLTLVRLFISCHGTWLINSFCHHWGQRDYDTKDASTNSFWVALLTFGEGWHNNHHRFMQSAYFGRKWNQIDMGKYLIWLMAKCHLAWGVHR